MSYRKVSVKFSSWNQDHSDILIALLGEIGYEGFTEYSSGFDAYIPEPGYDEEKLTNVLDRLEDFHFEWETTTIADQNWNQEWEKNYFKPVIISNKCLIRSPFHDPNPGLPLEIIIEPKMSFGTGHHETTKMMIELILELHLQGKRVLDMGCGSGILGILACMRGAAKVVAVDVDPWCTANSEENCKLNKVGNMEVLLGDASLLANLEPFDLIIANINRNILIADINHYSAKLQKGGLLVMSGFYENDARDIDSTAQLHGLRIISTITNNQWAAVTYKKPG